MVKIFNKATGEMLGRITEEQLQFLMNNLEEESLQDNDYYLTAETIDSFATQNAPEQLLNILRSAIGGNGDGEIRYERDEISS
ncbi:MAG: galactosyldiacylglycerol synthase [Verrucomicrobiota bacterium]|nr:galactosyldiacylglycerol synthase [Verrucomicrobiota bacterium]